MLHRNCFLKHVIEGKKKRGIDMMERRGRRCKQLFNGLKKTRACWILKDEELDGALWRTGLGIGYGPVLRHYRMSE
jgi:lauroyl/myristoyl acyltransferase